MHQIANHALRSISMYLHIAIQ